MIAADVAFHELLAAVDQLLKPDAGTDGRTDAVADLLGTLALRMTDLHEAREREVASFHRWLEERLGCRIDELPGKTTLEKYYEHANVQPLLEVISRNFPKRTQLDVRPPKGYGERNYDRDLIVQGYERSIRVLRPIMTQIDLTDRLIDLIVYRLYGLTPEEQALVDRATGYTAEV